MRWLTLLTTLPPTPTRHRVGVWRKLQRMGAIRLRGSAWILSGLRRHRCAVDMADTEAKPVLDFFHDDRVAGREGLAVG